MSFQLTTVTGSAQTGFTAPTYTVSASNAPVSNSIQKAVTALGGTQTGVTVHSVTDPFTITAFTPSRYKPIGSPNPVTGIVASIPKNSTSVVTRKGVAVSGDASQPKEVLFVKTVIDVPAGSESADIANIRAALSAHIGALTQQSSNLGDLIAQGIL